jgi:hypothetical protein
MSGVAKKTARKIAAKDADQYMLRLPPGMRDAVAKLAESNGRSINTEIVAAIEQHLKGPGRLDAIESFIEKHRQMLEEMSGYVWFGNDGVLADIERLQTQVNEIDERTGPTRYDE